MPKDYPRSRRIAEQIQRELSEIIRLELKDPRVGMITLTDVEVTPDIEHAKVFFTRLGAFGEASDNETVTRALQHAAGFLRSELAHRMRLRVVPDLRFEYDESVERGVRLSNLIDAAVASDQPKKSTRKKRAP
ncbi:MAG: 30S ribosome-binding factor RbfA [Betaproteobacteria bacterium]|nr:30S ribosome-binding factor RbfA [Betaproteobacteria bacterium]